MIIQNVHIDQEKYQKNDELLFSFLIKYLYFGFQFALQNYQVNQKFYSPVKFGEINGRRE